MKVKKMEKFGNKIGYMGCKWSSLKAPGTGNPLSHPVLELRNCPLPILALWGNKNWPPSMKVKKMEKDGNKIGLVGGKWSSSKAPGTWNPCLIKFWSWEIALFPIQHRAKKNQAKFSDTCSVRADGPCIGSPRLVGGRRAGNWNMQEFFCTMLYWPSWVIRIGLPVWKWKRWKNLETKMA